MKGLGIYKDKIAKYKYGLIAFGIYSVIIAGMLYYIAWSASNNPADSGESGIILLIPASPWIFFMPHSWLSPFVGFLCIFFNGFLIALTTHWISIFLRNKFKR